jgi:CDP-glucose 4,6-dehydratase
MGGYDPYSSSKGCAELVTAAYRSSFFGGAEGGSSEAAIASVRAGNVIGGGDWGKDRLIPDIARAVYESTSVVIRNPYAIRPWQHVLDPLHGYLLLAERLYTQGNEFAGAWNFGPNEGGAKPVGWIVEKLVEYWGGDLGVELSKEKNPHEANYLKLDSSKAVTRLGWQPLWDVETALRLIVDWYTAYGRNDNMYDVTKKQIKTYMESQ